MTAAALAVAVVLALVAAAAWRNAESDRAAAEEARREAEQAEERTANALRDTEEALRRATEAEEFAELQAALADEARQQAEDALLLAEEAQAALEAALSAERAQAVAAEEARLAADEAAEEAVAAAAAAELARDAAEVARIEAERERANATERVNLLLAILQPPSVIAGTVQPGETNTHAVEVPEDWVRFVAVLAETVPLRPETTDITAVLPPTMLRWSMVPFQVAAEPVRSMDECDCLEVGQPRPGIWVIEVTSAYPTDYTIEFSPESIPIRDLPRGVPTDGYAEIDTPERWMFTGTAGEHIRIEMIGEDINPDPGAVDSIDPTLELLDPSVRVIASAGGSGPGGAVLTATLPEDGRYIVRAGASQFGILTSGSYEITLVGATPPVDRGDLALGDTVAGSIDFVGQQEEWAFDGAAGQRVLFEARRAGSTPPPWLGLWDEAGQLLGREVVDGDRSLMAVLLPATGPYTLQVGGLFDSETGAYELSANVVPAVERGSLTLEQSATGSIDVFAQSDRWTFVGTAGQEIQVDVVATGGSFSPDLAILDPEGAPLALRFGGFSSAPSRAATLPVDGDYVIEVFGSFEVELGSYTITVTETVTVD